MSRPNSKPYFQPMVFVDIAVYREWIRQTTNGCCSKYNRN